MYNCDCELGIYGHASLYYYIQINLRSNRTIKLEIYVCLHILSSLSAFTKQEQHAYNWSKKETCGKERYNYDDPWACFIIVWNLSIFCRFTGSEYCWGHGHRYRRPSKTNFCDLKTCVWTHWRRAESDWGRDWFTRWKIKHKWMTRMS
jgi:hypothetical protein